MRDSTDLPEADLRDRCCLSRIRDALQSHGISLLHGADDRDRLLAAARSLCAVRQHRDSEPDGITVIAQRAHPPSGPSTAGFTDRELHPHTEGSSIPQPPHLLMIGCLETAGSGGNIRLVDGRRLYQAIADADPPMLTALRTPRTAYFGGAAGHLGAVFEPAGAGRLSIRLRLDDQAEFAPALRRHVGRLRSLVDELTIDIPTRRGSGYVLCNDRWLHGRAGFTGPRRMLRLIGDLPLMKPVLPGFSDPATAIARPRRPAAESPKDRKRVPQ